MKGMTRLGTTLAVGISILASTASGTAATESGLRLDGTFIQYQPWMMELDADAWQRELEAMQRAGLRTIVIQWLAHNDRTFIPQQADAVDPTEIILSFADRHGMEVVLGLYMDDDWWQWFPAGGLPERLVRRTRTIAEQAWSRYGRHGSFAGWYIPPEPADTLGPEAIPALKAFFRETSGLCRKLSGGKPVGFSPYLTGQLQAELVENHYADVLTDSGIDILMLQDGVGARNWDEVVHSRVVPLFRAMRDACLAAGVELWADVEIFHNQSGDPNRPRFLPSNTRRLAMQLAAENPFATRLIAFDFFHYMSPHRGERQRRFYEAYLQEYVDRPFHPVFGPSLIVDPGFAYYRDRSPESIAAEIRANGYSTVRYVAEPSVRVDPKLVDAFHRVGIGVWCMVFGNGTYSSGHMPPEWRQWSMVTRSHLTGATLPVPSFERLCLNNPHYREWKKQDLARTVRKGKFDGMEIAEAFWPEYPGVESPAYACFCDSCRQAFTRMFPQESALPDIVNADSPRSPARNPELWNKWLRFREATMRGFLDDLVNGPGGLRETSPDVAVSIWGLGLSKPDSVRRLREDHGQDAGRTAATVQPDVYCFQTHWPDWSRAGLEPDYVKSYLPFIKQLREHAPEMRLMIQGDIGSTKDAIRGRDWVDAFERACQDVGAESTCVYEYFIGGWTYHEPPRAADVRCKGERIHISMTRRIDPATANRPGAVQIDGWPTQVERVDGSVLVVVDPEPGRPGRRHVTLRGLGDDRQRRLFKDFPANISLEQKLCFQTHEPR